MNDPKYLGIPNINFSLTKKDDDREPKFSKQRLDRGFDDSETWSLRDTIANFIIPRLEAYIDLDVEEEEYTAKLIKFLEAMKLTARDQGSFILTDEENKIHKEGLDLFPEIFMGMWW